MPYIKQEDRDKLDFLIDDLAGDITNPGELNYVFTKLLLDFVALRGRNYNAFNSAIGVLESAKLEFYRRHVALYEDIKKEENGDVG